MLWSVFLHQRANHLFHERQNLCFRQAMRGVAAPRRQLYLNRQQGGTLSRHQLCMQQPILPGDHGDPSAKLSLIGITGTKGKTTTSYLLRSIYTHAGIQCGLIGTMFNIIGENNGKKKKEKT